MAYKVNDTVIYSTHGVCRVEEVTTRKFEGVSAEYYVLKPVYDNKSTIFVPSDNASVANKMRPVLSEEEIHELISSMPKEDAVWEDNANVRRDHYKEVIVSGDRTETIRMIKALFFHAREQKEKGKKLNIADERFMKDAERMLYEEFAYVLGIRPDQVLPFIMERIEGMQE